LTAFDPERTFTKAAILAEMTLDFRIYLLQAATRCKSKGAPFVQKFDFCNKPSKKLRLLVEFRLRPTRNPLISRVAGACGDN
jgi:hypothetical protein